MYLGLVTLKITCLNVLGWIINNTLGVFKQHAASK